MTLTDIRSATITDKGQIAISKQMRSHKGFGTGSKIAIISFEDHLELWPLSKVSEGMLTARASERALGKDWNSKDEERSWAYLREAPKKRR